MSEYRVMTLNMWADFIHIIGTKGFSKRIHAIESLIDIYQPDVVGAQEVTFGMLKYMEPILRDYAICGAHRKSLMNNEATPILYRKDRFIFVKGRTMWLSDTPDVEGSKYSLSQFPRIVTVVTLKDRNSGELVTFANTHLDVNLASIRNRQSDALCRILENETTPVCLTGDFNSTQANQSIQNIVEHGYHDCSKKEFGSTLRGAIGSRRFAFLPIDHIFVNRLFEPLRIQKLTDTPGGIWPSDHYPLLAIVATH